MRLYSIHVYFCTIRCFTISDLSLLHLFVTKNNVRRMSYGESGCIELTDNKNKRLLQICTRIFVLKIKVWTFKNVRVLLRQYVENLAPYVPSCIQRVSNRIQLVLPAFNCRVITPARCWVINPERPLQPGKIN